MSRPATLHVVSQSVEPKQALSEGKNGALQLAQLVPDSLYNHFALAENPFGMTPDPRFLYEAWTHHEAFNSLVGGIERGIGFQALIAAPGLGKTTLLFRILERFEAVARTAFVFQTQCTSREFMQYLLSELGSPAPGQEFVEMHEKLNRLLLRESQAGRRVIVVIDEAQNLDNAVLETVRLLSDFETRRDKLMQIIMAGQQQLADKLGQPELAQLRQRISVLTRLDPLGPEETKQYIRHRLMIAGHDGTELFTREALELIWECTQGVPRIINTLCFNALVESHSFQQSQIDGEVMRDVASRLDLLSSTADQDASPKRRQMSGSGQRSYSEGWDERTQPDDLGNALQLVAERVRTVTGATGAAIAFLNNGCMACRATSGRGTPDIGTPVNVDSGFAGECVRTGKILSCDDTEADSRVSRTACHALGIRSILSIPLCDAGRTVGLIQVFSTKPNAFNHVRLLKLQAMLQAMIPKRAGDESTLQRAKLVTPSTTSPRVNLGTDANSERGHPANQTNNEEPAVGLEQLQTGSNSTDRARLERVEQSRSCDAGAPQPIVADHHDAGARFSFSTNWVLVVVAVCLLAIAAILNHSEVIAWVLHQWHQSGKPSLN